MGVGRGQRNRPESKGEGEVRSCLQAVDRNCLLNLIRLHYQNLADLKTSPLVVEYLADEPGLMGKYEHLHKKNKD